MLGALYFYSLKPNFAFVSIRVSLEDHSFAGYSWILLSGWPSQDVLP